MVIKDIITERDKVRNIMDIIVSEKSYLDDIQIREVKCPKCNDNILLDILEYKFNLHDCKNGHSKNKILFNDFMKTQEKIVLYCNNCDQSSINPSYFHKCFTCKKNLCLSCKEKHDKKHEIMNLEEINSICKIHNGIFRKYCINCKKNICIFCEVEHKNHNFENFDDIIPDKTATLNEKKALIENIDI